MRQQAAFAPDCRVAKALQVAFERLCCVTKWPQAAFCSFCKAAKASQSSLGDFAVWQEFPSCLWVVLQSGEAFPLAFTSFCKVAKASRTVLNVFAGLQRLSGYGLPPFARVISFLEYSPAM